MALAIELAAARLPALGLDGLVAGLSDHLRLLVGGHRADERHRSVRDMLDWSQALLDRARAGGAAPGLGVRLAVHRLDAAAEVAGSRPLGPASSPTGWPGWPIRAC